jgi:hypothetical protein
MILGDRHRFAGQPRFDDDHGPGEEERLDVT